MTRNNLFRSVSIKLENSKIPSVVLYVGVVVATCLQKPAPYLINDAESYLNGSVALVSQSDVYQAGYLQLRGAWTPIFYIPAAFVQKIFGTGNDRPIINAAVLLQGALLVALVSVFLIPSVMKIFFPPNLTSLSVSAFLGWLVLRKFALYSLLDLWAVALILMSICLLKRKTILSIFAAGFILGVCSNIRPSYLPFVFASIAVAFFYIHFRALIFFFSFIGAQALQIAVNWRVNHRISLFPIDLSSVSREDFGLSLLVVRFDGVMYPKPEGGLSFCNPAMVKIALNEMPYNIFEYLLVLARHPISSFWFILEKIGTSLYWPVSAPYFEQRGTVDALFGSMILLITVIGLASLIFIQAPIFSLPFPRLLSFFVITWTLIGLCVNHVETRYALPIVIFGIVGVGGLIGQCFGSGCSRLNIRGRWLSIFGVLTIAALLLTAGYVGLHHTGACATSESLKKAWNLP